MATTILRMAERPTNLRWLHVLALPLCLLSVSTSAQGPARGPAPVRVDLSPSARLEADWTLDGNGAWAIRDGLLALDKAGVAGGPVRRPSALAILRVTPLTDATIDVELRSTAALPDKTPRRDALVIVGYQSPTRFYYVHISAARDAVHNGIFLVADADRRRIDTLSDRPILKDTAWRRIRVVRAPESGRLDVYADGDPQPIMRASDTTLTSGRVGVGSFDDTAEFRSIQVAGRAARGVDD
jgi:hypothetical protein